MKLASIFLDKIKCPMYFLKFNALVCLLIYLTYILKYIITVRCMYICMLVDVCIVYLYYWFLYVDLKVTHENCSMNVNWSILSSLFYHSIRLDYLLQPSPSVIFFSLHFLEHTFLPLWHFSSLSSTSQPHCLFPSFFHYSLKKRVISRSLLKSPSTKPPTAQLCYSRLITLCPLAIRSTADSRCSSGRCRLSSRIPLHHAMMALSL